MFVVNQESAAYIFLVFILRIWCWEQMVNWVSYFFQLILNLLCGGLVLKGEEVIGKSEMSRSIGLCSEEKSDKFVVCTVWKGS